ncbi:ATP-binding protein [Pontibacter russatus]|uniref:ATP-binding protein n=1 Tax=Pontibacter russatus TaxID=2694929 RepID=UPI00137AEF22|nr:ATP-binding protein [Pontibacter russatus]
MSLPSNETIRIVREQDVVLLLSRVREYSAQVSLQPLNQTRLITAASEMARNMLRYANGGRATIEALSKNARTGVKITFLDEGPGIPDIQQAMTSGFSTGNGLGLGLPGARRLVNEFDIQSKPGKGTCVTIIQWQDGR